MFVQSSRLLSSESSRWLVKCDFCGRANNSTGVDTEEATEKAHQQGFVKRPNGALWCSCCNMTCRHQPGDPNCSSSKNYVNYYAPDPPATPDASKYEILDVVRVGQNLVVKVRYPHCARCAYEGVKVMVFLNVQELTALKWRSIDPHFRSCTPKPFEAPSPAARFPASEEGWNDAIEYAKKK